jgi:AcrR family transcriptional regulator
MRKARISAAQQTTADSRANAIGVRRVRGRPTLDSAAQREKILSVASRFFIEQGYSETTLDEIAKAARITKRTIYQHVGDKAELFRIVCKERLPLAEHLTFRLSLGQLGLKDIVTSMARQLLQHSLAPEAIALERTLAIESLRFPELVSKVVEDGMAALNRNIALVFAELIALGAAPEQDISRAADIFYDVVIGNRSFRMTMGHTESPPDDKELAQRIDMFVDGYLLRGSSAAEVR